MIYGILNVDFKSELQLDMYKSVEWDLRADVIPDMRAIFLWNNKMPRNISQQYDMIAIKCLILCTHGFKHICALDYWVIFCIDAQIVPFLASENVLKLIPMSFR